MGRRWDRGEGSTNYIAVILLVAALTAVIVVKDVPEKVGGGVVAALCQVTGETGCDQGGAADSSGVDSPRAARSGGPSTAPVSSPTAPLSSPTAPVSSPTVPGGADPNDPAVQEYQNALNESGAARRDSAAAEGQFGQIDEEILAFLTDLIGLTDAKNCLTKGDIGACLSAAAGLVPWGKAFAILKSIPKIYKLWRRFKELWDTVNGARTRVAAARNRLMKALEACANPKKNSFVPGTRVLLADGVRRPIERIRTGDRVWATDPATGRAGARPVTALITGIGRKSLVDITIDPDGFPGGQRITITATDRHPFWVANTAAWIDAQDLAYGDSLVAPDGRSASVVATRERTRVQRVYNLTVADLHTYYVAAGSTPVLVHNCGPIQLNLNQIRARIASHVMSLHGFGTASIGTKFAENIDEDTLLEMIYSGVQSGTETGEVDAGGNHEHIFPWPGAGSKGEGFVRVWMTPKGELGGMWPIARA